MLARHIKPFVELGFTPKALATSQNSIFYWNGNTSHPEPAGWHDLVDAFIRHIEERYGRDEVRTWYFEVWNEPNLSGFWEGGDQKAYFELYDLTARTIKAIDPGFARRRSCHRWSGMGSRVSGARQAERRRCRLRDDAYVRRRWRLSRRRRQERYKALPISRRNHRRRPACSRANLGFAFPGLPLYFSEWSTSYTPRDAVHDSYISAPYILSKLKACQGMVQGMSYWTYTDLFEEPGPPTAPFQGGFGLLNRKAFASRPSSLTSTFMRFKETVSPRAIRRRLLATKGGDFTAVIWDFEPPNQKVSNRPFYTKVIPAHPAAPVQVQVTHLAPGAAYRVQVYRTGYHANDAYSAYIEMGSPKELNAAQITHLNELTRDLPVTDNIVHSSPDGTVEIAFPMNSNDIVLLKLVRL